MFIKDFGLDNGTNMHGTKLRRGFFYHVDFENGFASVVEVTSTWFASLHNFIGIL